MDKGAVIFRTALIVRVLYQCAEVAAVYLRGAVVALHKLDAQRPGAGAEHCQRLREYIVIYKELRAFRRSGILIQRVEEHAHGFCAGGRLIEQRSIGNGQPGKITHHRLEVEQAFQPALRNLCLVRRVLRVPSRVFKNVAQDYRRRMRIVIALADIGAIGLILYGSLLQLAQVIGLAEGRRHAQRVIHTDGIGDGAGNQLIEAAYADDSKHFRSIRFAGANMTGRKLPALAGE